MEDMIFDGSAFFYGGGARTGRVAQTIYMFLHSFSGLHESIPAYVGTQVITYAPMHVCTYVYVCKYAFMHHACM